MQLNNPARGTSFYESFSDLIFGTLIILLVVVLALMVRIRGKQSDYAKAVEAEIALNKYAGGSNETTWSFSLFLVGETPHVAFVPRDVWQNWDLNRFENSNSVRTMCGLAAGEEPGIAILSLSEFEASGAAFNLEMMYGAVIKPEVGDVLSRIYSVITPEQVGGVSAERLYQQVGGIHAGTYNANDRPSGDVQKASERYFAFIAGPGPPLPEGDEMQFFRQYEALRGRMQPIVVSGSGDAPCLRFAIDSNRQVQLGATTVSPREFRAILSSISIGRGFFVEYDAGSETPESPPSWVVRDILIPAGFDRRIPSKEAVDAIAND